MGKVNGRDAGTGHFLPGNDGGRPPDYRAEMVEQAYKLCLLGAVDRELADFFGVETRTIHRWKHEHPGFADALNRGKEIADAEVAHSLFQRAKGYSHEAVKIFMPQGAAEPVYAPYTEHYPPDTTAALRWLGTRQKRWQQKVPGEDDTSPLVVKVVKFAGDTSSE